MNTQETKQELINKLKGEIFELIKLKIPHSFVLVKSHSFLGIDYISIILSVSDHEINRVEHQFPQKVVLHLNVFENNRLDMELRAVENRIYRNIRPDDPREKFLVMVGVKIPFRKPKNEKAAVMKAIEKYCDSYIQTLKDNLPELRYKDIVDYNKVINL